ncbi:MAG: hypothetical protein HN897_08245, partial [Actinobacteria bacterium]|nr:hypothetical protein [Actinomycetota bacterium]
GNTAAASIPMAISDALAAGRLHPGDVVVMPAFGGGITWGTLIMRWGERTTPVGTHQGELPPTDATVFDLLENNLRFFAPLHDRDPADPIL